MCALQESENLEWMEKLFRNASRDMDDCAQHITRKTNVMIDLHFHHRESRGRKEWLVSYSSLVNSNLAMAGMDSRVLSKACFVVLLCPKAKAGVTGCTFGQQRQKQKKKSFIFGETPNRQEEASKVIAARNPRAVMASLTNPGRLLSTKALNMQHKSTRKQTNRCSSNKHAGSKRCV